MNTQPRFSVIDLNGQVCERYATRAYADLACVRLAKEMDYEKQDAEDKAFCLKYGVPFQPRRYFVMENV